MLGFDLIMRMQTCITVVTGVLTVRLHRAGGRQDPLARRVGAARRARPQAVIGALVFVMTGFGLGWVNAAADYSRYLPRSASSRGRGRLDDLRRRRSRRSSCWSSACCWPARRPKLSTAIGADPIGALATLLPTWFLVPFAIVAVLGLVGGAVLDIYSSGLALLTVGLRVPRYLAALIDGIDHDRRHDLRRVLRRQLPRPSSRAS